MKVPADCGQFCRAGRTARIPRGRWRRRRRILSAFFPAAARPYLHTSLMPWPSDGRTRRNVSVMALLAASLRQAAANAATCAGFIPHDSGPSGKCRDGADARRVLAAWRHLARHDDAASEMFWAIVTSMFIGHCILLLTMLPLIGPCRKSRWCPIASLFNHHPGVPCRRLWR